MRYILIILLLSACRKDIVKQREAESLQEHGMMRVQIIIGGAIKTDTQSILLDLNKMRWHGTVGGSPGIDYLISKYKFRCMTNN